MNRHQFIDWKTPYADKDLEFLLKLVDAVVKSPNREIARDRAVGVGTNCRMTGVEARRLIEEFIKLNYFEEVMPSCFFCFN